MRRIAFCSGRMPGTLHFQNETSFEWRVVSKCNSSQAILRKHICNKNKNLWVRSDMYVVLPRIQILTQVITNPQVPWQRCIFAPNMRNSRLQPHISEHTSRRHQEVKTRGAIATSKPSHHNCPKRSYLVAVNKIVGSRRLTECA